MNAAKIAVLLLLLAPSLPQADEARLQRDPFQPPRLEKKTSSPSPGIADAPPAVYAPPISVAPDFKLRAVLHAGAQSMVNVDGNLISVGEEIEGYRLVAIHERKAELVKGGDKVVLTLDQKGMP